MHDHNETAGARVNHVLYLGADPELPASMTPLLAEQGIEIVSVSAPPGGGGRQFLALILDTALLAPSQTLQSWIASLAKGGVSAPHLLVIAHSKEIGLRLQALRANAVACFVAPITAAEVVSALLLACRPQPKTARRVLVVDDDATQTLLVERFLTAAGFQVRALTDPLKVLEVLAVFEPDLILLDLNMPGADGAELAPIIREQYPFRSIPILFLSVERDPERQLEALNMGGDAFLTKPIDPALLVKTVSQRIESYHSLRRRFELAEQYDPATGLATRRHFLMVLERALADSTHTPLGSGLLLVALDGTTRIAERLGPGSIDLLRNRLGLRLLKLLTPDDLAACLDDHYHALLIRRAEPEALRQVATELCAAMANPPFKIAEQSVSVTLSIGLGFVRAAGGDALTLISRAEQACAEAQRCGGNRLAIYHPNAVGVGDQLHERRIDGLIARALGKPPVGQGFRLFFQPLLAVGTRPRRCQEVILRLTEENGALLPAGDFMPIAERNGRAVAIDHWVMDQALDILAAHAKTRPEISLLVRQHLTSLTAPGRVLELLGQFSAHGLRTRAAMLGFALDHLLEHRRTSITLCKMLHKLGIDVCLLEVDQTPAALDLVAALRPAVVRLTSESVRDTGPERLVPWVQRLRQLGSEVIAAGIDTPSQIGPVWASGIDYAQGALIQPPLAQPVFDWDEVVVA